MNRIFSNLSAAWEWGVGEESFLCGFGKGRAIVAKARLLEITPG
jgi:hypothetical protein